MRDEREGDRSDHENERTGTREGTEPQTGDDQDSLIVLLGQCYLGYVSHGALNLQVGELKTSDAREHEGQETGDIETRRDGQVFLCARTWASCHPRLAAPCRTPLNYPAPGRAQAAGKDIRCDGARVLPV